MESSDVRVLFGTDGDTYVDGVLFFAFTIRSSFDFWGHAHRLQLEPQIDDENFEATQRLFLWRPHLAWQI